jgi:hypothetical protein
LFSKYSYIEGFEEYILGEISGQRYHAKSNVSSICDLREYNSYQYEKPFLACQVILGLSDPKNESSIFLFQRMQIELLDSSF